MSKFELDLELLGKEIFPKSIDRIPVKGNEQKMIRVAFDLFRLDGSNKEDLWVVQADDDGNEFLVRTYDLPEEEEFSKNACWEAHCDKKEKNLTLSYEGVPVKRFALLDYGVMDKEDVAVFKSVVLRKVATDSDFANFLLKDLKMRGDGGRPRDGSGPRCNKGLPLGDIGVDFCSGDKSAEFDLSSVFPEGNAVIIIEEEDKPLVLEEKTESDKQNVEKTPSEDYDDPEDWWDNLSDEDQVLLFEKFKDVPSITKEQAFKLTKLEIKLAKKK